MKKKQKKQHFRTWARVVSLLLVLIMLTNDFLGGGTMHQIRTGVLLPLPGTTCRSVRSFWKTMPHLHRN